MKQFQPPSFLQGIEKGLIRQISHRVRRSSAEIPAGAVVVPGSRNVRGESGRAWGPSLYAPVIVKYRDEKTDRSARLEDYLR